MVQKQLDRLRPFAHKLRKLAGLRTERTIRRFIIKDASPKFFKALLLPVIIEATTYLLSRLAIASCEQGN
jgi:hypothetical protein